MSTGYATSSGTTRRLGEDATSSRGDDGVAAVDDPSQLTVELGPEPAAVMTRVDNGQGPWSAIPGESESVPKEDGAMPMPRKKNTFQKTASGNQTFQVLDSGTSRFKEQSYSSRAENQASGGVDAHVVGSERGSGLQRSGSLTSESLSLNYSQRDGEERGKEMALEASQEQSDRAAVTGPTRNLRQPDSQSEFRSQNSGSVRERGLSLPQSGGRPALGPVGFDPPEPHKDVEGSTLREPQEPQGLHGAQGPQGSRLRELQPIQLAASTPAAGPRVFAPVAGTGQPVGIEKLTAGTGPVATQVVGPGEVVRTGRAPEVGLGISGGHNSLAEAPSSPPKRPELATVKRLTALPVFEVQSRPAKYPVTKPHVNDEHWRQFHVSGTPRLITMFSAECNPYFDWQALGLYYSFKRSGQPGRFLRLLACSEEKVAKYRGLDLCPTLVCPNWDINPRTGDLYPAINKPVGVAHWLAHGGETLDVDYVLILDADQIMRAPVIPWELGAEPGRIVAAPYGYLIGCDNILGELHLKKNRYICDKVGGVLGMHIDDVRALVPWWINKTEEVRADTDHYATNITGDVFGKGWISEMYGYSFGASEAGLRHIINEDVMLYPGYAPKDRSDPRVLHYGLKTSVMNWSFAKFHHRTDIVFQCGAHFDDPPDVSELPADLSYEERRRDLLSVELVAVLNRALREQHRRIGCDPENEKDVGVMDLNGGALAPSGALWIDVWSGNASAKPQRLPGGGLTKGLGLLERELAFETMVLTRKLGNRRIEVPGMEKGLYVERNSGSSSSSREQQLTPSSPHRASSAARLIEREQHKVNQSVEPDEDDIAKPFPSEGKLSVSGQPGVRRKHFLKDHDQDRHSLFRRATAEKLFSDFSAAAAAAESSHLAMLLSFSVGLLIGLVVLVVANRFFCGRRRTSRKAHRLKRDGVRRARLLSL